MRPTAAEVAAAYLLDRAAQYEADSGCCVALVDAAVGIAGGEHLKSFDEGEFDDELMARVRKLRGRTAPPVDPHMGVDPLEGEDDEC